MKKITEWMSKAKNLPILLMVLLCANKWLIEGIIDQTLIELVLIGAALLMILWQSGFSIKAQSAIWLIYCGSILINVLFHNSAVNVWGRSLIMVTVVMYAVLAEYKQFDFVKIRKLLVVMALFHGCMILLQFVLKGKFNDAYFSLLVKNVALSAKSYFKRGYYFGVHYSPHEVAGVLSFAIVALLLNVLLNAERKWLYAGLAGFLLIPLFLTGKKGVMALAVLAFAVVMVIHLVTGKEWKKLKIALGLMIGAGVILLIAIQLFPNNALLKRFAQFFAQLSSGESSSSGRDDLYNFALQAWKTKPVFGIGWYHFIGMTTEDFGYYFAHHVNLDYLQWLCEMGVVGLVLNLIPLGITLYQTVIISVKVIGKMENDDKKWVVLFALFVQFFTVVYAFVEVPFYDIYFFAMYMLSCMVINGIYMENVGVFGAKVYKRLKEYYEQRRQIG